MLSQMLAKLFAGSPLMLLPCIGLCIFMTVFVVVTIRVMRSRAAKYDDVAMLPLADDEEVRHGR